MRELTDRLIIKSLRLSLNRSALDAILLGDGLSQLHRLYLIAMTDGLCQHHQLMALGSRGGNSTRTRLVPTLVIAKQCSYVSLAGGAECSQVWPCGHLVTWKIVFVVCFSGLSPGPLMKGGM